jgi:hypothetical protein
MTRQTGALAPESAISRDGGWDARLESDQRALDRHVTGHLASLRAAVVEHALAASAASLILSGSTARGSRTPISDLDYHLVGGPIDVSDFSRELDLHVLTAAKSLDLARRFVATGDQDGAIVQGRAALSLAARAPLLDLRVFPLSRAELPDQLREVGMRHAAAALTASIYGTPSLAELDRALATGDALLRSS